MSFLLKTDPKARKIPCTNAKKVQGIFVQNSGVVQHGMSRCLGGRRGERNLLLLYLHRAEDARAAADVGEADGRFGQPGLDEGIVESSG